MCACACGGERDFTQTQNNSKKPIKRELLLKCLLYVGIIISLLVLPYLITSAFFTTNLWIDSSSTIRANKNGEVNSNETRFGSLSFIDVDLSTSIIEAMIIKAKINSRSNLQLSTPSLPYYIKIAKLF